MNRTEVQLDYFVAESKGHVARGVLEKAERILQELVGQEVETSKCFVNERGAGEPRAPETIQTEVASPALTANVAGLQIGVAAVEPFRAAYETLPDALVIADGRGHVVLTNTQFERLFGYSREEILGQPVEYFIPEGLREQLAQNWQRAFDYAHVRPLVANFQLLGRHRDSHEFPLEISFSPLQSHAQTMVVATIRDMTNQRQIDSQIRGLEARCRTLVEGLPAVTFMAALDGKSNEYYVSPQIESLLGFSQEEWLSKPRLWYTQLHPNDRKRWKVEFAETCSTGRPFNSVFRFYSQSGQIVWVHGEAKVVCDERGRPIYLLGMAFDITRLKEVEEQLRQLNQDLESRVEERTVELVSANDSLYQQIFEKQKAESEIRRINQELAEAHEKAVAANQTKSQFLANMSHELRTPLNAIIGYSELLLLLAAKKQDSSMQADLERIHKAGTHLLELINDILDISKIEAGKMKIELETFDIEPMVEELHKTALPLAAKNSNELVVTNARDFPLIRADITRLKQCLLNLLSNACKFTSEGKVTFSVTRQNVDAKPWIVFSVQDTGIGLSPEQIAKLFQPFTQADTSTTRKYGGTGLGLAITKKLSESMGGTIHCESNLGLGSTFSIRLPEFVGPK